MSEAIDSLRQYILPTETVLWEGRSGRRAGGNVGLLLIPVIAAIVLVLLFQTPLMGDWYLAPSSLPLLLLFVLPFFMAAFFFLAGPRDERYLVTSRSILISARSWVGKAQVTVIPLRNLQQITLRSFAGSTGTLVFGSSPAGNANTDSSSRFSLPTFWKIEQPGEVYQLIRKQIDELTSR
jgi:hypothetical protein